jgi:hypothetical protein
MAYFALVFPINSARIGLRLARKVEMMMMMMMMKMIIIIIIIIIMIKVKDSRNSPGVSQRVQGGLGSQIS